MRQLLMFTAVVGTAAFALAGLAGASPGTTTRESVSSAEVEADEDSFGPGMNGDGSVVVYLSEATNLVSGDTNGRLDIFVRDRVAGTTTRVSVSTAGAQGNADSYDPKITPDARYVAFVSLASNLVSGDTNGGGDIFVRDRQTSQTTRVSVSSAGVQGNGESSDPTISADGRYVAFTSNSSNLVPDDDNDTQDVFVHDRQTGQTTRVSVSSAGEEGVGVSHEGDISDDGNWVAFSSRAILVAGDLNSSFDVFLHNRQTGETTRVSVRTNGTEGNKHSDRPVVSSDGQIVAFDSLATNLVGGDTNRVQDIFVHDVQTGTTTRVSVKSNGAQVPKMSFNPDISGDGRLVSFNSAAKLADNDTEKHKDVYVHDRQTGQTTLESVSTSGEQSNEQSIRTSLSTDGQLLAFSSKGTNLVEGDLNEARDIFVHELAVSS